MKIALKTGKTIITVKSAFHENQHFYSIIYMDYLIPVCIYQQCLLLYFSQHQDHQVNRLHIQVNVPCHVYKVFDQTLHQLPVTAKS